jgi:Sulfotransferase family
MILPPDRRGQGNADVAGLIVRQQAAPDVLIHLHIPKTGGTSLNSIVQHGFRDDEVFGVEVFEHMGPELRDGLGLATYNYCLQLRGAYHAEDWRRIRYVTGHVPFGLHRAFGGKVKYFTVFRDPVDRIISDFFHRIEENNPARDNGRTLSFEEYVESYHEVRLSNYQVRILAGFRMLDNKEVPVERRHLEQAKRNVSEHFLAAAPLEGMTELALMIRRTYGWPMRRLLTEYKNKTRRRLSVNEVSPRVRKIVEECNFFDLELYHWVRQRFATQCQLFEPHLARDRRILNVVSTALNDAGRMLPWQVRKRLAQIFFYA